jgi:hypothetical protein
MKPARAREWDYAPAPDGESFTDAEGNLVLGFHDRIDGDDGAELLAAFEAFEGQPLQLRPILCRWASEVECRIRGFEEGTFVPCTSRAKNPMHMWRVEVPATQPVAFPQSLVDLLPETYSDWRHDACEQYRDECDSPVVSFYEGNASIDRPDGFDRLSALDEEPQS